MTEVLKCARNGCNSTFTLTSNHEEACLYHKGNPVFHEGRKGWSCCKKRVDSFEEMIAIPGCESGSHIPLSTEPKPATQTTTTTVSSAQKAVSMVTPTPVQVSSADGVETFSSKLHSTPTVGSSSSSKPEVKLPPKEVEDPPDAVIAIGARCLHHSCDKTFVGDESRTEECKYHPGTTIFHEGSKGWSCCKANAAIFEEFLKMPGCTKGKHRFIPKPEEREDLVRCRYDWYQNSNAVIASIYAKGIDKKTSTITFEKGSFKAVLNLPDDKTYEKTFQLAGHIEPEKSSYEILSTKVEIKLWKKGASTWGRLEDEEPELLKFQVSNAVKVPQNN
eukprot:TRINITY_DN6065_c1_g1_i1.p1 TRINITY_DN6065_c1_g1~~TRINITY_DN6065_c1_g1_i1.p1  ORF type:complete len:333 (-),score=65.19 TRINITY_DN6065_c1_g1_i1:47-1045(-)